LKIMIAIAVPKDAQNMFRLKMLGEEGSGKF